MIDEGCLCIQNNNSENKEIIMLQDKDSKQGKVKSKFFWTKSFLVSQKGVQNRHIRRNAVGINSVVRSVAFRIESNQ